MQRGAVLSRRLDSWAFTTNYALWLAGTIVSCLGAVNFAALLFAGLVSARDVSPWSNGFGLIFCLALGARFIINTAWLRRKRRISAEVDADAGP